MSKLSELLGKGRVRVSLPLFTYEIPLDQFTDSKSVDERIARLAAVRRDLEAAADAVTSLQREANVRKTEVEELRGTLVRLHEDKESAEKLLAVSTESIARILKSASSKGRIRGLAEGVVIGLATGVASSAIVWYFTSV
ncbi:MAG: hypothetical protein PVJ57_06750 [Phycisphaerae bacterium]